MFNNHEIAEYKLNLSNGVLSYKKVNDSKEYKYTVPNVNMFYDDVHKNVLENNSNSTNAKIVYDYKAGATNSWLHVLENVHVARYGTFVTTPKITSSEAKVNIKTNRATRPGILSSFLILKIFFILLFLFACKVSVKN